MLPQQEKQFPVSGASTYEQSQAAFYRNLPDLLKKHSGQWVAYRGDEFLGFASTQTQLFQRCVRRGLKDDEFAVMFANAAALTDHEEIDLPVNS